MKKQGGFTLIELIVVIIILGIMSAFALPRYVDLTEKATDSVVSGAYGAANSANALVHSAYLAENDPSIASVSTEKGPVAVQHGYAMVDEPGLDGILAAAGISDADYKSVDDSSPTTSATEVSVTARSARDGASCFVYQEAVDANTPAVLAIGVWNDAGVIGTFESGECTI